VRIDYRLKLCCISLGWTSEFKSVDPPRQFVDIQVRGPYRTWHHTHEFFVVDEGTLMVDTVRYSLACGPLGWLANATFVRRSLEAIFDYRFQRVAEIFSDDS